jgi:hypothetical protein
VASLNLEQRANLLLEAHDYAQFENDESMKSNALEILLGKMKSDDIENILVDLKVNENLIYETGWNVFKHQIPFWIFILATLLLCYFCFKHNLSLIPVLGLVSCLFMMSEMGVSNWTGFTIWLLVGLVIYFLYSYKNSKLNTQQ